MLQSGSSPTALHALKVGTVVLRVLGVRWSMSIRMSIRVAQWGGGGSGSHNRMLWPQVAPGIGTETDGVFCTKRVVHHKKHLSGSMPKPLSWVLVLGTAALCRACRALCSVGSRDLWTRPHCCVSPQVAGAHVQCRCTVGLLTRSASALALPGQPHVAVAGGT